MSRPRLFPAAFGGFALAVASGASADLLLVPAEYPTIQSAIEAAPNGATITVGAGVYVEDIDFLGKTLFVEGFGSDSVIHGTGTGPVVRIVSGEGDATTLDGFTITGGRSASGGGIEIRDSSPRIIRNVIAGNSSTGVGSGIYIGGATAAPFIANNLMIFNTGVDGSDPHTVQVANSSPTILNNTIVRNDSNAILTSGSGTPEIRNNILARNGSRTADGGVKGRGICDFAPGTTTQYNVFYRNVRAALLTAGEDFRSIRRAQVELARPRLANNLDGKLRFAEGSLPRTLEEATPSRFVPSSDPERPSRALNAGDPGPAYKNNDGTRNTIGFTGGPYAPQF